MELSKQMPKSKTKKIKPVIAWAIVGSWFNALCLENADEGKVMIYEKRKDAKREFDRLFNVRIAKVEIREIINK